MNKKQLETKIADLKAGIESPSTDEKYKPQLRELLKQAEDELAALSKAETPAEKKTVEKKAESTVEKAKKLVSKVKAEPKKAAGGVKKSAKQLIDDCRKLLSRNKQEKKTAAKRIEKRKKAGKPVELTPSETVSKTAKAVSSKVISIKEKTDKGLPAGEVNKLSSGIIATIRATIKGILATGDKRAFLDDLVDEINSLKSNLPKAAEFGGNVDFNSGAGMFARGGKISEKDVRALYEKADALYTGHIEMDGSLNYSYKDFGYLSDELAQVEVGFLNIDNHSSYADELREEGFKLTAKEAYDILAHRIQSIEDDLASGGSYARGGKTDDEEGGMAEYFAKKKDETFEIEDENAEMLYSQVKEIKHHAEEILSLMCAKTKVESWVVAKGERSSTDLSDIYHYLDGRKEMFCCGGSLEEGGELEGAGMFAKGGGIGDTIKVGDIVKLPEIRMPDGRIQFEKVENGKVIYIESNIYGVLNPRTNRIHQVRIDQIEKYAKGGSVEDNIADRYARLTDAEAKRLDELQNKVNINEQTESEDAEYDRLVHKYRGWEYKEVKSDGSYAKGGGLSRDRMFVSQQEWEKNYKRKTAGRRYKHEAGGELGSQKKYYAILNILGEFNNGVPVTIIADSKAEIIDKINEWSKKNLPVENQFYYSLNDLDDQSRMYFGKPLAHYISDDFTMLTDRKDVFNTDVEDITKELGVKPQQMEFGGAIVDYTDGTLADPRFDINSPVFEKGGGVKDYEEKSRAMRATILAIQKSKINPFDVSPEFAKEMAQDIGHPITDKEAIRISKGFGYEGSYAKGGGLSRDRMFVSQQEWEKNYKRKTAGRRYKHEEGGFVNEGAGMFANGGSVESLYEKLIKEYEKDGWGKISSFDRFIEAKKESALEKGDAELYNKLCDVVYMYEKDFYAKGGGIDGELKNALIVAEGSVFSSDFSAKYDVVKDRFSSGKNSNAEELAKQRKADLQKEGYAVKLKKVNFDDLARGTGYFITAVKRKYAEGGSVLGEDTVGRVDDPSLSDSSTY